MITEERSARGVDKLPALPWAGGRLGREFSRPRRERLNSFKSRLTLFRIRPHRTCRIQETFAQFLAMASSSPLSELLFTESRDFLIDKEGAPVKADAIAGKVVGLLIGPHWLPSPLEHIISLIKDAHDQLKDQPVAFVYVAVPRDEDLITTIKMYGQTSQLDERPEEESFADVLTKLPDGCLAIPLDDQTKRTEIAGKHKAGIFTLAFFGADGLVHSEQGLALLDKWGAEGFPFNDDRIAELQKAVEVKRANQNLPLLLGQEGNGELISSKDSNKVKVADLEGKTVALYFSAHWCPPCKKFTPILKSVYEELEAKGEDFKIVYISSDDTQESFTEYFGQMPWLSVPYEDEKTRKYLSNWFEVEGIPTLVILDKQGKTVSTEGMELVYKYGVEAYPFSVERLQELKQVEEAKRASQTLESLLVTDDRDFVLSKSGQVKVASLDGKTVGLYFSGHWCPPCRKFTPKLKSVYDELKGQDKSFEVIFVSSDRSEEAFSEYYESMPWLALPFDDSAIRSLSQYFDIEGIPQLVIIGPKGKTITTDGRELIGLYGASAFPFTEDDVLRVKAEIDKKYQDRPKEVTLPKDENDAERHEHPLKLTDSAYGGQVYVCDHCDEQGSGWVYHCEPCGFDLHPDCVDEITGKKGQPSEEGAKSSEGGGAKPGYVCEGNLCRKN